MRTKILAAFLAGGLLVGAGFLTSVISAPGTAQAQDDVESQEESSEPDDDRHLARILGFLDEVLADLVDDDTLTQEEADAVSAAAADKAEDVWQRFRDEHPRKLRPFAHGLRFGELLDDGGIDQDEYDGLDDDHPLKQLDPGEFLDDGLITPDELRQLVHDLWQQRKDT